MDMHRTPEMWMKACALALAELSRGISGSRAATIALVREPLIDGTGKCPRDRCLDCGRERTHHGREAPL